MDARNSGLNNPNTATNNAAAQMTAKKIFCPVVTDDMMHSFEMDVGIKNTLKDVWF
jgi:hypothetical protein